MKKGKVHTDLTGEDLEIFVLFDIGVKRCCLIRRTRGGGGIKTREGGYRSDAGWQNGESR